MRVHLQMTQTVLHYTRVECTECEWETCSLLVTEGCFISYEMTKKYYVNVGFLCCHVIRFKHLCTIFYVFYNHLQFDSLYFEIQMLSVVLLYSILPFVVKT